VSPRSNRSVPGSPRPTPCVRQCRGANAAASFSCGHAGCCATRARRSTAPSRRRPPATWAAQPQGAAPRHHPPARATETMRSAALASLTIERRTALSVCDRLELGQGGDVIAGVPAAPRHRSGRRRTPARTTPSWSSTISPSDVRQRSLSRAVAPRRCARREAVDGVLRRVAARDHGCRSRSAGSMSEGSRATAPALFQSGA